MCLTPFISTQLSDFKHSAQTFLFFLDENRDIVRHPDHMHVNCTSSEHFRGDIIVALVDCEEFANLEDVTLCVFHQKKSTNQPRLHVQ